MALMDRIRGAWDVFWSGPASSNRSPTDPFFYMMNPYGMTKSRQWITADNAMEVSAVYACVTLLSETIASLPLKVYENTSSGKREKTEGKLYGLLKNPIGFQNEFEWMENLVGCLALRGNSYHRIAPMRSELDPIHPSRVKVEMDENRRLRYTVTVDSESYEYSQSEVLHIKGLSSDGMQGMSPVALARETIGAAKSAEEHAATFFGNSAIPGGIISTKNKLDPESKKRLRSDFEEMHGGDNKHRLGVFDMEMSWQQIGMNWEDAQFLETRKFEISEIARWFRIPPHMIGDVERSTSWGTGIEQQSIGFVRYTLRPWLKRIETAINSSLVLPNDGPVYVKFAVEGLLRGDSAARASFYSTMKTSKIMTTNEIRALEDMNPIEGGDELENPATSSGSNPQPQHEPEQESDASSIFVRDVAERLVSCEQNAFTKRQKYASDDPERYLAWVDEWMTGHRGRVEKAMKPLWELSKIAPEMGSGMVDNYILARKGAILAHSDDAWKPEAVSRQIAKELKQWTS